MTTSPTSTKRRRWPWVVGGSLLALVIIGSCAANTGTSAGTTYAPTGTTPVTSLITTAPAPSPAYSRPSGPVTNIGDGTFEVGTGAGQVPPGTYHTSGPSGDNFMGCYWEREKDTTGDSIINNDISKGPTTVTIKSSDGAFKTTGCEPWSK